MQRVSRGQWEMSRRKRLTIINPISLIDMSVKIEDIHRLGLWKFLDGKLLWQRSKCAGSPINQLFLYFLFQTWPKLKAALINRGTLKIKF